MDKGKSFKISKHLIAKAYKLVKANKGAPGADGISLEVYELALKDNLYKLWNRMSSGSYLPSPVRAVEIPKKRKYHIIFTSIFNFKINYGLFFSICYCNLRMIKNYAFAIF